MATPSSAPVFSWDWFTSDSSGFFTSIAAVIACLQAALFVWQLVYMRKSMDHATIASNAAQESAKIAREAFTKMERPYIYIFGIKGPVCDFNDMDETEYLKYCVANHGKTPAKIRKVMFGINIGQEPEEPESGAPWEPLLRRSILLPGEMRDDLYRLLPEGTPTIQYVTEDQGPSEKMEPVTKDGECFFFTVKVQYTGPFSDDHETSACWFWDDHTGAMVEYGGDSLNYLR